MHRYYPDSLRNVCIDKRSVLFITIDSCRYDTFSGAALPHMKSFGALYRAQSPSYFTFGAHASMFVGFTPGVATASDRFINPKVGKVFRVAAPGMTRTPYDAYYLSGDSIVSGFNNAGYVTIGTGGVAWFNQAIPSGRTLTRGFQHFFYPGNTYSLSRQLSWIAETLLGAEGKPTFLFVNVGETHVPYYHEGAPWSPDDNPCKPFQTVDRAADCRIRQTACVEFVDLKIGALLDVFRDASVVICADHGDCWGEDGLWEHGVAHEMTLTVPLIIRVNGIGT
jgi:hypothetical protein